MPVRIKFIDGAREPDAAQAKAWLRQGNVVKPSWIIDDHLALFLKEWTGSYGFLQQAEFIRHLTLYAEQYELFAGIQDIVGDIVRQFPPQAYHYVGIGRSPAPIIAALENAGYNAFTIPLSDFRPRNRDASVTDRVLSQPRLSNVQNDAVSAHFLRYLGRLKRQRILLIDYCQTATSLVAAQEQLQHAIDGDACHRHREVHALALCRSGGDTFQAEAVANAVGYTSWKQPIDRFMNAATRQRFVDRWNVMPIAKVMGAETHRQRLVEAALSGQRFDKLAEYGSFKILDPATPPVPVRHQAPGGTTAYEALRVELKNVP